MTNLQQLESAIRQLPRDDVATLLEWLREFHAQQWEQQIAEDLDAGRLDAVIEEAERDYAQGRATTLPLP